MKIDNTISQDDNEFARYLASFIVDKQSDIGVYLEQDRIYNLIVEFLDSLP